MMILILCLMAQCPRTIEDDFFMPITHCDDYDWENNNNSYNLENLFGSPASPKDFEDTLRCFSKTIVPLPLQFPTTIISLWIKTYTCRSKNNSQFLLLLQDISKYSLTF